MNHTLLQQDRLAPPENHAAYFEVLDPHPRAGCIKVFDAEKREERYVDVQRLVADLHAGKLTVLRTGKPRFSHAAQPEDTALHERSAFIRSVMLRIRDFREKLGISFLQAYRYAAEEYAQTATPQSPPFPSQSAIYRYRRADVAGLPALRGDKNKGNRGPRYSQDVISTICLLAERHYLQPQSRWTLTRLTEAANLEVYGSAHPVDRPPISNKYVKHVVQRILSPDPDHARMLPTDAIAGKSFAKKRIRAELPFERVEQDALHLPFVVQTPGGVTSQLYLVHAIDCCTGYPLGWQLVVGGVTDTDSLACAELYMAPIKQQRFQELGINHAMNVCGTPGELVFDNGPEAKGSRIQNLERLGVDVKHCRARAGQEKPFIERLNRSLKEALEALSGCTRLDGKDGQRDPVALGDELMTVEQLERWIVRWYYEKWVHTPLQRLQWDLILTTETKGGTPAERWAYFEESCFAISLPPSRAEWLAALYEHTERRVNRKTGVTIDGLHYKGDNIGPLLEKYGEQQPLKVLYNPDDFRHIYVYEGDELPLVVLSHEHLRPETPAWSFTEAKEQLKKQQSKFKPSQQAEQFDRDLHAQNVADSRPPKLKRPSKHDRNRETAQREKEAQAIARAARQPGPMPPSTTSGKPPSTAATPATDALLDEVMLLPVLDRDSGGLL
ncbi:MAG: DDE-type integrase/transposase/recombinase [Proteobacteria bacterium]|nr:DDE-type integrase/transposase/recombinase [Pseudomonadota bacterium]